MPDHDRRRPARPATPCWWHLYRESGSVKVFHVDLMPDTAREASAMDWLDAQEQVRWDHFRHPRPQREFGLSRAALRAILCSQLGCSNEELTFNTSEYGKPFALAGGIQAPVRFNISHSGSHGLIALAPEGRIGVDVEERVTRLGIDGTIESMFTSNERAELASAEGEQKIHLFFRLWTMKEALVKALGRGLYLDLSGFEIPVAVRGGVERCSTFHFPQVPAVRWQLENLGSRGFAAAIAYELDPGPPGNLGETLS